MREKATWRGQDIKRMIERKMKMAPRGSFLFEIEENYSEDSAKAAAEIILMDLQDIDRINMQVEVYYVYKVRVAWHE